MELLERVRRAGSVFLIGNGGSHANAMHAQNDLLSCGIRAFTLDPATLTAFANDHGYENVYALWLETVGQKGDLLIAFSGSGKSPNILKACATAERIGMDVYRLFGAELGQDMQTAANPQLVVGHALMRGLRK